MQSCQNWFILMKQLDGDSLIEQSHQIRTLITLHLLEIMWEKKRKKKEKKARLLRGKEIVEVDDFFGLKLLA